VAHLLNLLTPEVTDKCVQYIASCQTWEGGLGGVPGNEAHGGYTFCGLAALSILKATDAIDIPLLLQWAVHRQMRLEGGFQGRENKLVDSCYSFWQGALFPILHDALTTSPHLHSPPPSVPVTTKYNDYLWNYYHNKLNIPPKPQTSSESTLTTETTTEPISVTPITSERESVSIEEIDEETSAQQLKENGTDSGEAKDKLEEKTSEPEPEELQINEGDWLFSQTQLQDYLLLCAQDPQGGFRDKIGKGRDYYHTCYSLCGLSVAQNNLPNSRVSVIGSSKNLLKPMSVVHGIRQDKVDQALAYFQSLPALQTRSPS